MSLMGCRSRPRVRKFSKRFCGSLRARIPNRKIWATANLNSCRGKSERSCNAFTATRRREIFHHPSRCDRSWEFDQAVGWAEDEVSAIQLRRHGGCAVSPGRRGTWHQTRTHGHRQFDGWYERLAMGREISWLHGCSRTYGVAAHCNGIAQLDPAPHDA